MSSSFDIRRFPDLPPEVLKAFEAQQAALEASRMEASVERAARLHQEAVLSESWQDPFYRQDDRHGNNI